MKLNIFIILALILFSAYANISISHTNEDNQTVLLEFKTPIDDPSTKALRIEVTMTSKYLYTFNYTVGVACVITQPDGIIPPIQDNKVFTVAFICLNNNGCPPGSNPTNMLLLGSFDGMCLSLHLFEKFSISFYHPIFFLDIKINS